ncbi:hypothetical protein AWB68_08867 [Caballeronia choica]|uniref:Uncharacterized protein n=1 Tax=Caballeronia choica TaxID=326476 RepID=A0A158L5R8_9BURK|nr:hypothetical protein AWB68_08867 [Caballeronia choica]
MRGRRAVHEVTAYPGDQRTGELGSRLKGDEQHHALTVGASRRRVSRSLAQTLLDHDRVANFGDVVQHPIDLARPNVDATHDEYAVTAPVQARRSFRRKLDEIAVGPDVRMGFEIGSVKAFTVSVAEKTQRARRKWVHAHQLPYAVRLRALVPRLHVQCEAFALRLACIDRQIRVAEHKAAENVSATGNRLQLQRLHVIAHPVELRVVEDRACRHHGG